MQALGRINCRKWGRCVPALVALWATAALQASEPRFGVILGGAGEDYAAAVATDAAGNSYVAGMTYSPNFPVTAGAFQTTIGGNGTLANPNSIVSDAFVAKIAPNGTVLWCTFLGGSSDDRATGVGVDSSGNVLVTGWTRSLDFPLLNALQSKNNGGWDAFVTKLDPTGSKLIYSTYLGGPQDDNPYGLAVDAGGNAYVTGAVGEAAGFTGFSASATGYGMFVSKVSPQGALVYSFFEPNVNFAGIGAAAAIAVDSTGSAYVTGTAATAVAARPTYFFGSSGAYQAMVLKLSADGSKVVYETYLGGSANAYGMAIAVDGTGAAYVGGLTYSVDFPLQHPLPIALGARPLWQSNDGSATWAPHDNLHFAFLAALIADPSTPRTLYAAATDTGIFKSTDGGVTWNSANQGIQGTVQVLAIDPLHPQTIYAASGAKANEGYVYNPVLPAMVYKSVDGGATWNAIDTSTTQEALQIAVDPVNSNNLYVVWDTVTRKSSDSGATWTTLTFPGTYITSLAPDPRTSGAIYAVSAYTLTGSPPFHVNVTPAYIWISTDGGATWTQNANPPAQVATWTIDMSTNPATIYNGLSSRTTDGGVTWTTLPQSAVSSSETGAIAVDGSGTLYAAVYNQGIYISHDHGLTWTNSNSPVPPSTAGNLGISVIGLTASFGTLYATVQNQQTSGFVTKLSPDGSTLVFSTLLTGHVSVAPTVLYAAEPGVFETQNWISGIAVDSAGNVTVAGGTRAADFPTANPLQASSGGAADAFVATLAADGSRLTYSTYFGGSLDDSALAVALDAQANLVIAGQTWSSNFPIPGGVQPPAGQLGDAFVVKIAPVSPTISTVLNAASYQPGIEAGSWAMIQGTGLSNTTRTWQSSDFVGPNLPVALDGVSVTIDGIPAFVEYLSPTQINVLAPSDSATGSVNVVVNNHGAYSAPVAAQLKSAAPAFFLSGATNYAAASRLPDYATVGTAASPAKPGDTIVLWGTGFGATTPAVTAGLTVSGAPVVTTTPTVALGGISVPVISAVMTTGSAGLYQITIQIPANAPTGALAVQASASGAQTPAGVSLFVGNQ